MYDNTPPSLSFSINNGAEYTNSTTVNLDILANDNGSGVYTMAFSFDYITWQPIPEPQDTLLLTLPATDEEHIIFVRVTDKANNTCLPVAERIVLDTESPECSVLINDNATYTNSEEITLRTTGSDMLSGESDMSFSSDMEIWSSWQPFNYMNNFRLSGDDGIKIVYMRLRDHAGNFAVCYDTITLDTTPPHSLTISANNGAAETKSTEINLTLSAVDELSGIELMTIYTHLNQTEVWEEFNDTIKFELPNHDGPIILCFNVKDLAGNIAYPAITTIVLNTIKSDTIPNPDTNTPKSDIFNIYIWIFVLAIVIILIFLIIIIKHKKLLKTDKVESTNKDQSEDEFLNISKDKIEPTKTVNETEQLSTIPIVPGLDSDIKQLPQLPAAQKQNGSNDKDITQ
jgi:hypothetical protein